MDSNIVNILFPKIRKLENEIKELKRQQKINSTTNPEPKITRSENGALRMEYTVKVPTSIPSYTVKVPTSTCIPSFTFLGYPAEINPEKKA